MPVLSLPTPLSEKERLSTTSGMVSRIQQEASAGRRIHSLETKRLEKQRQMDLQRSEIHPSHVQARLQEGPPQQPPAPSSRPQTSGLLPPAVPQDDPPGRPIVYLPVRKRRRDDDA